MKKKKAVKRKPSLEVRVAKAVRKEINAALRTMDREHRNRRAATAPLIDLMDATRRQVDDHNIAIARLVGKRKSGSVR